MSHLLLNTSKVTLQSTASSSLIDKASTTLDAREHLRRSRKDNVFGFDRGAPKATGRFVGEERGKKGRRSHQLGLFLNTVKHQHDTWAKRHTHTDTLRARNTGARDQQVLDTIIQKCLPVPALHPPPPVSRRERRGFTLHPVPEGTVTPPEPLPLRPPALGEDVTAPSSQTHTTTLSRSVKA
ncbi:unnamed protein product [Arctogadus glacialis]